MSWQLTCVIAIVLSALLPFSARAQDEREMVWVDGRALFRVGPAGSTDATTRARQIE